jgi:ankyrin repeat protein
VCGTNGEGNAKFEGGGDKWEMLANELAEKYFSGGRIGLLACAEFHFCADCNNSGKSSRRVFVEALGDDYCSSVKSFKGDREKGVNEKDKANSMLLVWDERDFERVELEVQLASLGKPRRFHFVYLKNKGNSFKSVFVFVGVHMRSRNLKTLIPDDFSQLEQFLQQHQEIGVPFIVIGDWNKNPNDLRKLLFDSTANRLERSCCMLKISKRFNLKGHDDFAVKLSVSKLQESIKHEEGFKKLQAKLANKDGTVKTTASRSIDNIIFSNYGLTMTRGFSVFKNEDMRAKIGGAKRHFPYSCELKLTDDVGLAMPLALDENGSDLLWAARVGDEQRCIILFQRQSKDLRSSDSFYVNGAVDRLGRSALMFAALAGHKNVVNFLLTKGADVNTRDVYGNIALILAAENGRKSVVKLLLDGKESIDRCTCDVNAKNKCGNTSLLTAVEYRQNGVIKVLLADGRVDVHAEGEHCTMALNVAAMFGYVDVVKLMLACDRIDVNDVDRDGRTALHFAAWAGCEDIVDFLIAKGVDLNATSNGGITALHNAALFGLDYVLKRLLANEVILVNKKKIVTGHTALHIAAMKGYTDATMVLLTDCRIELNIEDNNGKTALDLAKNECKFCFSITK